MKVSVVIPTRNRPELMARAVRAVAAQRHPATEVIVVDDGSEAGARHALAQLVATLPTGRVISVEHGVTAGPGTGPAQARNAGLQRAKGELLAFCDDDDEWTDPEHLSRVVALFQAHPLMDLHIANQVGVRQGQVQIENWLQGLALPVKADSESVPVSKSMLCAASTFPHLNTLVLRRELAVHVGGFWPHVRYEEDRDFFWRTLDAAREVQATLRVIARHHIPNPERQDNASTQQRLDDKRLVSALVSRHIAVSVRTPAIQDLALAGEGDMLRQLSLAALQQKRPGTAGRLAWAALAMRFSWKWLAWCLSQTLRRWR